MLVAVEVAAEGVARRMDAGETGHVCLSAAAAAQGSRPEQNTSLWGLARSGSEPQTPATNQESRRPFRLRTNRDPGRRAGGCTVIEVTWRRSRGGLAGADRADGAASEVDFGCSAFHLESRWSAILPEAQPQNRHRLITSDLAHTEPRADLA